MKKYSALITLIVGLAGGVAALYGYGPDFAAVQAAICGAPAAAAE